MNGQEKEADESSPGRLPSSSFTALRLHGYRLGSPRQPWEGLRLGTVRFLPRGVKKADYAKKDYFDVWLPALAPEAALVQQIRAAAQAGQDAAPFFRQYRQWLLKDPARRQLLLLLAAVARHTPISVGCYCADEEKCHRSVLLAVLRAEA